MPAPSTRPDDLRLACSGCGAEIGLDRQAPLVRRLRPFLEAHAGCPATSYDAEMRTAFQIPA